MVLLEHQLGLHARSAGCADSSAKRFLQRLFVLWQGDSIDSMLSCRMWEAGPLRDLSAWRVTIPNILAKPEPDNPRKYYQTFSIDVRRVDVLESELVGPARKHCTTLDDAVYI